MTELSRTQLLIEYYRRLVPRNRVHPNCPIFSPDFAPTTAIVCTPAASKEFSGCIGHRPEATRSYSVLPLCRDCKAFIRLNRGDNTHKTRFFPIGSTGPEGSLG